MTEAQDPGTPLDVYEIAHLAGGPRRVVETAVVALVESGRLRVVVPTGELQVVAQRPRHPVEAAVLDAVGVRGHRSLDTVTLRLRSDARLVDLGAGLAARGLLTRPEAPRRWPGRSVTAAGRRQLRALRRRPPVDLLAGGTSALPVALRGPAAMSDVEERAALFHPPRPVHRAGPWRRSADGARPAAVPGTAAYQGQTGMAWGGGSGGGDSGGI